MFGFIKKYNKNQELKGVLLKKYFNSRNQKKIIKKAAKESAEDQNTLLTKYHRLSSS